MADFFLVFGIVIAVLCVDAVVCWLQIMIAGAWEDDDWWLVPLITNTLGFAMSLAFHIFNHIK